jgi:hypothetical protein
MTQKMDDDLRRSRAFLVNVRTKKLDPVLYQSLGYTLIPPTARVSIYK